jgi:hypothetical protein
MASGEDDAGTATDLDFVGTWKLIEERKPLTRRK